LTAAWLDAEQDQNKYGGRDSLQMSDFESIDQFTSIMPEVVRERHRDAILAGVIPTENNTLPEALA
jgi:hypothetical protein